MNQSHSSRDIRPEKMLGQARNRLEAGHSREAEKIAQDVLSIQPNSAEAWELIGDARLGDQKAQQAVDAFAAALRIHPRLGYLRTKLGVALIAMGQRKSAEKELRLAIEDDPDHAPAHMNLGTLLAEQGKGEEAEACLRKAIEIDPNYPEALRNLGNVLNSQSRWRDAIKNRIGDFPILFYDIPPQSNRGPNRIGMSPCPLVKQPYC